ncbi:unnamed protein product (macronuclear) [Paramecium tetraurelia]|uniref:Uncharacterized protein n=1 Tax=Paramecium tetraurelia TaxID=5888 RepID=A0BQU3_PARTE|nr:uncharacterized protein GSPATT00031139001 [Paramecium tetraurelia]CAK60910.1 unnamed protein product [Paramecium tetraurelia]|eukprot:XP_001428308.1 hypothetical protein (macronuclear) [Paramecium tetraurelia strain d4-2]
MLFESSIRTGDPRLSTRNKQAQTTEVVNAYDQSFNGRVIYARNLFSKLFLQMIIICVYVWIVHSIPALDHFLEETKWIFWLSLGICIGTATLALIYRNRITVSPTNWLVFIVFTLSFASVCGCLVAFGNSQIGLLLFVNFASLIFFLFLYSSTVRRKITYSGAVLFVSASILIVFELFTIFTKISLFWIMFISLSSFLFAFLLLYDTYTNLNCGDSYDINKADDVSGSVTIYWDIILLFLKMAELIKDNLSNRKN